MIKFLLQRPIAVLMAFTACFIVGLVTYFTIPVSLLPDIAIPEITVQVSGQNTSARELENTVVKTIRQQLMQVASLRDIHSETRDGAAIIRLNFDFGTNTDLAFIEVNEKIDAAMNYLPREVERPRVIKASATDIPVFCLNLTLKSDSAYSEINEGSFLDLCQFAETVIKRRIEQLPEVAMVDVTGILKRQLQIVPDMKLLKMSEITLDDLEAALTSNNIEPGSMTVRDGYYEYNIKFSTLLRTPEDVENIYIRKNNHIFQLKDLARISVVPEKETGASLSNGKRAVTLAVIKQADENMDNMKEALAEVTDYFASVYPDIDFSVSRNQTELLDYTISNLKQNLSLGFLFICIVAILFLGDIKSPAVIGLSMVVSLIISFLFFYLCKMSLNIISISGLILALGMMIDSSIIVTENITQYRTRGDSLEEACNKGTTEVITPMLSSTFTTIAVFVPLVFMSGIAGAIFFDQAFAVTVGLMVSYFTGIMLLPVLYKLVYSIPDIKHKGFNMRINNLVKEHTLDRFYDTGVDFVFRHKTASLIFIAITLPLCAFLFYEIPKSRMPEIDQNELIAHVEWNENIHIDENQSRVSQLFASIDNQVQEHTAYVGQQQFLLNRDREMSVSESELYFKTEKPTGIAPLQKSVEKWIKTHYPMAVISFSPPETVFEKLFVTGEADIVAELHTRNKSEAPEASVLNKIEQQIEAKTGHTPVGITFDNQLNITIDRQKLLLYNVDYNEVYRLLKTAFKENEVATLRSYQQYLPITLAGEEQTVNEVLQKTLVNTVPDTEGNVRYIPLQSLVRVTPGEDLKTITAGKNGEYIPFSFYDIDNAEQLMENVKKEIDTDWDIDFSGSFFSNRQMLNELVVILFISILLMYFILAAQFESFKDPLIIMLTVPLAIAGALVFMYFGDITMNIFSQIGIIMLIGLVAKNGILIVEFANQKQEAGEDKMSAIKDAALQRLRPILMTSASTVLGLIPLAFATGEGCNQRIAMGTAVVGGMVVSTLLTMYIVPAIYSYISTNRIKKLQE